MDPMLIPATVLITGIIFIFCLTIYRLLKMKSKPVINSNIIHNQILGTATQYIKSGQLIQIASSNSFQTTQTPQQSTKSDIDLYY